MKHLNIFTLKDRDTLIKARKGETKFGEHIQVLTNLNNIYDSISTLDVRYVIFGIKEDVGVFANHGKTGTSKAWDATVKILLNTQSNKANTAKQVLVLGHLDYTEDLKSITESSLGATKQIQKARELVEVIDKDVTFLVSEVVRAGKIPVIIGGGHNNSYGNIKGSALALNKRVNAINFDAHSDFRPEEGRHSGNGFSYAYAEGFLKHYFIFGLHENYTSEKLFKTINKLKEVQYLTYEDIEVRETTTFQDAMTVAQEHVCKRPFGIEIDCDAIEYIPSSAATPSGFSIKQARQFIHTFGMFKEVVYLHICEAAPKSKNKDSVGKLISYLITDFIRACAS
jgi:formiminoglutamase